MRAILASTGLRRRRSRRTMSALRPRAAVHVPGDDSGRRESSPTTERSSTTPIRSSGRCSTCSPKTGVRCSACPRSSEATAPGAYYNGPSIDGTRPGHLLREPARPGGDAEVRDAHARLPRGHPGTSLPDRASRRSIEGLAVLPRASSRSPPTSRAGRSTPSGSPHENGFDHDPFDRLGALDARACSAPCGSSSTRASTASAGRASRRSTTCSEHRHARGRGRQRDRALHREPRPGVRVQGRPAAILELRERARQRLGARFDIRRFHDVVLTNGAVPLDILERRVDAWIRAEESAGKDTRG